MTVWRKGMLAAVVCSDWGHELGGQYGDAPEVGDIFTVRGVQRKVRIRKSPISLIFGQRNTFLLIKGHGWCEHTLFRPVVEDNQDTALIERIKRCQPARKSVEA